MPKINARRMAEIIELPSYAQLALLTAEKYPKQGPSQFKRPYYAPALDGIRASYETSDPAAAIANAVCVAQGVGNKSRRQKLLEVLQKFEDSPQYRRHLTLQTRSKIEVALGTVSLRASPDIYANDSKGPLVIYYHMKMLPYGAETARRLLEIAHWLYEENELEIAPNRIELVDLTSGVLHRIKTRRASTIRQMKQTAKVIESLWDAL